MTTIERRFDKHDFSFSDWHRYQLHEMLAVIDLDCVEYCYRCNTPLALIELARDIGQPNKSTTVTRKLAQMAKVPAYLVFYTSNHQSKRAAAMLKLRVQGISPPTPEVELSPLQYELFLISLRSRHKCYQSVSLDWWELIYTQQDIEKISVLL